MATTSLSPEDERLIDETLIAKCALLDIVILRNKTRGLRDVHFNEYYIVRWNGAHWVYWGTRDNFSNVAGFASIDEALDTFVKHPNHFSFL